MLFNSFSYLAFLVVVFALYWTMPDRFRRLFLALASYVFYMSWKPEYGLLILALTVVNYFLGLKIASAMENAPPEVSGKASPAKKLLVLGLVFNIGCLCFFKYTNFILMSLFTAITSGGKLAHMPQVETWQSPAINILLPLGISFFTFEFIHYIVDIHRGSKPVKNFLDFTLFASFFPSQIAGPIKRFQDFMFQLQEKPVFKQAQFNAGLYLVLQGFFKKVALGDNIGPIVAQGFDHLSTCSVLDTWIAVAGFGFQIFFDFSGYTDIGIGSALLLGYKVPENFNMPFIACCLTDFWRRWHISLSTWLRDYLFFPLGGSRNGPWQTRRNTLIVMALGGLWHGAAWTYVAWGILHGVGLVLSKDWQTFTARLAETNPWLKTLRATAFWHCGGVLFTWLFLCQTFIVFRAQNFSDVLICAGKLFGIGVAQTGTGLVTAALLQSTLMLTVPAYLAFACVRYWTIKRAKEAAKLKALLSAQPGADGAQGESAQAQVAELKATQKPVAVEALLNAAQKLRDFWSESAAFRWCSAISLTTLISGLAPGQLSPFIYFQF